MDILVAEELVGQTEQPGEQDKTEINQEILSIE